MVGSILILLDAVERRGLAGGVQEVAASLDAWGRPRAFYGNTTHENCPYLYLFDEGTMAKSLIDKAGCRYGIGCKGPGAWCDSPLRRLERPRELVRGKRAVHRAACSPISPTGSRRSIRKTSGNAPRPPAVESPALRRAALRQAKTPRASSPGPAQECAADCPIVIQRLRRSVRKTAGRIARKKSWPFPSPLIPSPALAKAACLKARLDVADGVVKDAWLTGGMFPGL